MRNASEQGKEDVNGVPTVHYRGMVDHATLTLRMAKKMRSGLKTVRDALGEDLPVFADAWIDGSGGAVRTRLSIRYQALNVAVTLNLSRIGQAVKAVAPPSGSVVAFSGATGVLPG